MHLVLQQQQGHACRWCGDGANFIEHVEYGDAFCNLTCQTDFYTYQLRIPGPLKKLITKRPASRQREFKVRVIAREDVYPGKKTSVVCNKNKSVNNITLSEKDGAIITTLMGGDSVIYSEQQPGTDYLIKYTLQEVPLPVEMFASRGVNIDFVNQRGQAKTTWTIHEDLLRDVPVKQMAPLNEKGVLFLGITRSATSLVERYPELILRLAYSSSAKAVVVSTLFMRYDYSVINPVSCNDGTGARRI